MSPQKIKKINTKPYLKIISSLTRLASQVRTALASEVIGIKISIYDVLSGGRIAIRLGTK